MLNRARILLKADVGKHSEGKPLIDRKSDSPDALETSTATVQSVRERFCRQGLDAALERSAPDRLYERSLDGRAEARLIALACSDPPQRAGAVEPSSARKVVRPWSWAWSKASRTRP